MFREGECQSKMSSILGTGLRLKKLLKRLAAMFGVDDICIIAGVALVAVGVWQIYHPGAYILIGLVLFWWGYTGARSR